jgi:hypothetical protein
LLRNLNIDNESLKFLDFLAVERNFMAQAIKFSCYIQIQGEIEHMETTNAMSELYQPSEVGRKT